jgi:hypothetical protein
MAISVLLVTEVIVGNVAGSSVSLMLACLLIGSASVYHWNKARKAVSSMAASFL